MNPPPDPAPARTAAAKPLSPADRALLDGFARRWLLWAVPLIAACMLAVAWHWSLPPAGALGFRFTQSLPVLAVAALALNLPSFWLQRRALEAQLRRGEPVHARRFALRFYLINLGLAVLLSALCWVPLLWLLFFYRLYPIVFWLLPSHAVLGLLLGRWLERLS
jgi:hypothetical protein